MKKNESCTYLFDKEKGLLYISLSFEDLNNLDECEDWFVINVNEYESQYEDDPIQELINEVI